MKDVYRWMIFYTLINVRQRKAFVKQMSFRYWKKLHLLLHDGGFWKQSARFKERYKLKKWIQGFQYVVECLCYLLCNSKHKHNYFSIYYYIIFVAYDESSVPRTMLKNLHRCPLRSKFPAMQLVKYKQQRVRGGGSKWITAHFSMRIQIKEQADMHTLLNKFCLLIKFRPQFLSHSQLVHFHFCSFPKHMYFLYFSKWCWVLDNLLLSVMTRAWIINEWILINSCVHIEAVDINLNITFYE